MHAQVEPEGPGVAGRLPAASKESLVNHQASPYVFGDPGYFHWGSTPVLGDDQQYHLFYDRWPKANPRGMFGWLYITEIAHAVAKNPEGPYQFKDVALSSPGDDPVGRWDAVNTHNAHCQRFKDPKTGKMKYYLYFIANRGEKTMSDPWMVHIKHQRIGVAVADRPEGPWVREKEPVCVPGGPLQHYVVNPGVTQLPDGRFLMVLKGRGVVPGKPNEWGPMLHGWALADQPTGPFKIQDNLLFPGSVSAEDPCVWVHDGRVFAAVKDWSGKLSGQGAGISWVYGDLQADGGIKWSIPKQPLISGRVLKWDDGTETKVHTMERPFVLLDKTGKPSHLYVACCLENEFVGSSQTPKNPPSEIKSANLPVNVCIPLSTKEGKP